MVRRGDLPANPRDAEQAISARLLGAATRRVTNIEDPRERERARGEWVQRLRRELAYRRFLARLFHVQPDSWVLKGGVALMFRLDPNRPSYDIDIAYVEAGVDHAIALRHMTNTVRVDLGDRFIFELGVPRSLIDEVGAITVPVVVRIGAKEFARFNVDIPQPRAGVPSERFELPPTGIGFDVIDDMPQLRLLPLENQLVDKICAIFERNGIDGLQFSSRSRDLADVAMIAAQRSVDGSLLLRALEPELERRATARLPNGLPTTFELPAAQLKQWRQTWMRSARKPPINFDTAFELGGSFLGPVLALRIENLVWSPTSSEWI